MRSNPLLTSYRANLQPQTVIELCSDLLKIVALAAFVFGVILGSKHWIFVAIISGILSIAAYAYSQSSNTETWDDWMRLMVFGVRRSPIVQYPAQPTPRLRSKSTSPATSPTTQFQISRKPTFSLGQQSESS